MKLKYLYPHWGSEHLNLKDWLAIVKSNNFDGIEINIPKNPNFYSNFKNELYALKNENPNFIFVAQQVSGIKKETVKEYIENVLERLNNLVQFQPSFINSHTGKDHYSFSDNCKVINAIEEFSVKTNIPVFHEIHRGRFTFHSLSTIKYLEIFPNIKFVGDLSHWCVVSESMLEDQEEIIDKIIPNIFHLHARVGFTQAPQVNNPFAPEWEPHLDIFTTWWQKIINYHTSQSVFTITPEFGPFPYMPQTPFDQSPLANQMELNIKMKKHL
jgi:sugar phosphate isomerase/epimerase